MLDNTPFFHLFTNVLHREMVLSGFEVLENTWIDVSVHRYGIKYRKRIVNLKGSVTEHKVDFIAMPMGNALILCYGLIEGSGEVDAKIKIYGREAIDDVTHRFRFKFIYKLIERLSASLGDLPLDVKLIICEYLNVEDIVQLTCVNREWSTITNEDILWKKLMMKDFPRTAEFILSAKRRFCWKKIYQELYRRRKRCWEERGLEAPVALLALPDVPRFLPIEPPPP